MVSIQQCVGGFLGKYLPEVPSDTYFLLFFTLMLLFPMLFDVLMPNMTFINAANNI